MLVILRSQKLFLYQKVGIIVPNKMVVKGQ